MKKIIIAIVGLLSIGMMAQKSVSINEDIDGLKISAGLLVELYTNADENKIVASEKVFEAINYKVRENQLKISSSIETLLEGDVPLELKVYVKDLNNLNVVQGSEVKFINKFETDELFLRAGEGSTISGEIYVNTLEAKVISGGEIEIVGEAKSQEVEVNTGGEYDGEDFITENTFVKISYGGEAEVYASKNCEAKVIVGGTIDIYGNPEFLNEKTNFGGEINLKK
jgi:hypothetical protein